MCLDVGASTGGFTDCLLQHGAGRVIAVDTGYGQMDFKLRQDPRVRLLEKTNARYLTEDVIGEKVDLIAIDVAFISATLVLPSVINAAFPQSSDERRGRQVIVLVKPQFEAGREFVGKGGIVRDEAAQLASVEKVRRTLLDLACAEHRCNRVAHPRRGGEPRIPSPGCFLAAAFSLRLWWLRFSPRILYNLSFAHRPLDHALVINMASSSSSSGKKVAAIISRPARPEVARIFPELLKWLHAHDYHVIVDPETSKYSNGHEEVPRSQMSSRLWIW